jgi:hypothetical protein
MFITYNYRAGIAQSVQYLGYELDDFRGKSFLSSPKRHDQFWGPTSLLFMATGGYFPEGKVTEVAHAHLPDTEVKNVWSCTFASSSCLHSVNKNNFTFVQYTRVITVKM